MEKDHTGKIVENVESSDNYMRITFTDGSSIEVQVRTTEEGWLVFYED